MKDVDVRVPMVFCEYPNRIAAHLDDGWHECQYNLNALVCKAQGPDARSRLASTKLGQSLDPRHFLRRVAVGVHDVINVNADARFFGNLVA